MSTLWLVENKNEDMILFDHDILSQQYQKAQKQILKKHAFHALNSFQLHAWQRRKHKKFHQLVYPAHRTTKLHS